MEPNGEAIAEPKGIAVISWFNSELSNERFGVCFLSFPRDPISVEGSLCGNGRVSFLKSIIASIAVRCFSFDGWVTSAGSGALTSDKNVRKSGLVGNESSFVYKFPSCHNSASNQIQCLNFSHQHLTGNGIKFVVVLQVGAVILPSRTFLLSMKAHGSLFNVRSGRCEFLGTPSIFGFFMGICNPTISACSAVISVVVSDTVRPCLIRKKRETLTKMHGGHAQMVIQGITAGCTDSIQRVRF